MDWPVWIEAIAAALSAACTVVLAVATVRLWNSTQGLHTETRRLASLAETQSQDMKRSIEVAERAAKAAESALIIGDRAWMEIKAKATGPLVFNATKILATVSLIMENVGRSPATNVTLYAQLYADKFEALRCIEAELVEKNALILNAEYNMGTIFFPGDPRAEDECEMTLDLAPFVRRIEEQDLAASELGAEPIGRNNPAIGLFALYVLPADPSRRARYTVRILEIRKNYGGWGAQFDGSEAILNAQEWTLVQSSVSMQSKVSGFAI